MANNNKLDTANNLTGLSDVLELVTDAWNYPSSRTSSLRGMLSARDTWRYLSGREIAGVSGKARQEIV